jgi:hypothetical protein
MGSMLKFDSDRRELVRERRNARIERNLERRQARERKHSQTADVPSAPSATQALAERELRSTVDRIVIDALDRHGGSRRRQLRRPRAPVCRTRRSRRGRQRLHRWRARLCRTRPSRSRRGGRRWHRPAMGNGRPASRAVSATSPRSGSVAARRSRRRATRPAGGSPARGSRRRSPTRWRRSSTPRPRRGARSATSSRRRSRPGGLSRSARRATGAVGGQPRRGAQLAPRPARPRTCAGGVRGLRDPRPGAPHGVAQRAALPAAAQPCT